MIAPSFPSCFTLECQQPLHSQKAQNALTDTERVKNKHSHSLIQESLTLFWDNQW